MTDPRPRKSVLLESGERCAYFEGGSGPDVLLLHGAFVTSHDMAASLLGPLSRRFHVVATDRPGHGLSTRPRFAAAPRRQAELVVEAIRALGLKRPIVVGHSSGGSVALELALGWPEEISSVIALSPLAFAEPRLEQLLFGHRSIPLLGDMEKESGGAGLDASCLPLLWPAMFLPQAMPDAFRETMAFDEVRSGPGLLSNGEDAMAVFSLAGNSWRYAACKVPVRVIYGDQDVVANPWIHSRALARLLGSKAVRAPGLGHMLHHFATDLIVEAAVEAASLDGRAQSLSKTG